MRNVSFEGDRATWAATPQIFDSLRGQLRGALCHPGEPGYEQARTIWNAMIDKHPAAVIRAAGTADVMRAVNFAREHQLLLSVRAAATTSRATRSAMAAS